MRGGGGEGVKKFMISKFEKKSGSKFQYLPGEGKSGLFSVVRGFRNLRV